MFGHFKAEEFLNMIEGVGLPAERQSHLDSCADCATRLRSIESLHSNLTEFADDNSAIPEPDWSGFRASVRNELLSRSVKRESAIRRWTGWRVRPAMAWALSFALLLCVSTGGYLWHRAEDRIASAPIAKTVEPAIADPNEPMLDISDPDIDSAALETEKAVWASEGVFEEVAQLEGEQAEQVRLLLQSSPKAGGTMEQQ